MKKKKNTIIVKATGYLQQITALFIIIVSLKKGGNI